MVWQRSSALSSQPVPILIVVVKVGVRAWLARGYFIPGGASPGGVVRLRSSVSHIVGHGHLLTSAWVPQGSSELVGDPYGSVSWSYTNTGLSSLPSGLVRPRRAPSGHIGHIGHRSVSSQNIKFVPKWVENCAFAPKQRPNDSNRLSGPIRTTPEAKKPPQKMFFFRKTAPGGPGGPM